MRIKVPWGSLALLAASLVFCFLLLELAARIVSYNMGKGFWQRPNSFISPFFVTADYPPPIFEWRDGDLVGVFRDGEAVPLEKSADELRIVSLGGSTTVNGRNSEGLTYTGLVEQRLQEQFPGHQIRVLNGAADGFATAHSLANLSLRLLAFQPDVVTVYHNINDWTAADFGRELVPDYANKYLDDAFLAYEHRSGLGGTAFRFSRGLQMVKWRLKVLKQMLERSSRGEGVVNPQLGQQVFSQNLRSIAALAQGHGSSVVLMTQGHRDGEDESPQGVYNELIRSMDRDSGAIVFDLASELNGKAEYFLDPVHLTSDGIRKIAEQLTPVLAAELRSREASEASPAASNQGAAGSAAVTSTEIRQPAMP